MTEQKAFVPNPLPATYFHLSNIGQLDDSVELPIVLENKYTVDFWTKYITKYGIDGFKLVENAKSDCVNVTTSKLEKDVHLIITTSGFTVSRIGKKKPNKGEEHKPIYEGTMLIYKDKQVSVNGDKVTPFAPGIKLYDLMFKLSCISYNLLDEINNTNAKVGMIAKPIMVPYTPYSSAPLNMEKKELYRKPHENPFVTLTFDIGKALLKVKSGPRAGTEFDPCTKFTVMEHVRGSWMPRQSKTKISLDTLTKDIPELSIATMATIDMSYISTKPAMMSLRAMIKYIAYIPNPRPPTQEASSISPDDDMYAQLAGLIVHDAPKVDLIPADFMRNIQEEFTYTDATNATNDVDVDGTLD